MKKEIVSLNSLDKNFKREMSLEERFEILNNSSQNAIRGGNSPECPTQGNGGDGCSSYTAPCIINSCQFSGIGECGFGGCDLCNNAWDVLCSLYT